VRCFTATHKNKKIQHGASILSTLAPHLTELSKVFQARCFDFAQVKASVELCINKLSDAAVNSELEVNCDKSDSELGNLERWTVWLIVCVKWHGVLEGCRKISKLMVPIHKKGDRCE